MIFFDRSPFATAVVTSAMLRTCVGEVRGEPLTLSVRSFHVPETPFTRAWPPSLPSVPTSLATRVTSSANDESWSTIALTVRADAEELALHGAAVDLEGHLLREVALGDGVDDARDLDGGADEVLDDGVERRERLGPVAAQACGRGALRQAALAADCAADAGDLLRDRLAAVGDLVERPAQVGAEPAAARRQPYGEVAVPGCGERGEELLELLAGHLVVGIPILGRRGGGPSALRRPPPAFTRDGHSCPLVKE